MWRGLEVARSRTRQEREDGRCAELLGVRFEEVGGHARGSQGRADTQVLMPARCKVAGAAKTHLQIWEGAGLYMRAGGFATLVASTCIVWPTSKIIRMLLENGTQLAS